MAYSDSGESFFANSNFDFANDNNSGSTDSNTRPEANALSITLWNKEVKLGEMVDGLVKLCVSDYLPEGQIYLYYTVRERSQYMLANSKKVSRKYNIGMTPGLVNAPKNLAPKEDRSTSEDAKSLKRTFSDTNKADSDEKALLWGNDERNELAGEDLDLKDKCEYSNDDVRNGYPNQISRLRRNQIKPLDGQIKKIQMGKQEDKKVKFNSSLIDNGEIIGNNKQNLAESIIQALGTNAHLQSTNKIMKTSQDTKVSNDGSIVFFEKLIKVFTIHNPINKSSLLFVPFRIDLQDQKDLLCSADVHFELTDTTDVVRMNEQVDYFQLSLIHNIKFVFLPNDAVKKSYGLKSLSSDMRLGDIDLPTFKSLILNLEADANIILDETDFKVIPNMQEHFNNLFMEKIQLTTRITRLMCLPIRSTFMLNISIDRTIVNDQTDHLNVALKYPKKMIGAFNYLEIILLMKFSSKVQPRVFKELVMLSEHVDLRNRYISRNSKYLEFVHRFSLEKLYNMNFHTVEVS